MGVAGVAATELKWVWLVLPPHRAEMGVAGVAATPG
jgi:hypothetical protein